MLTNAAHRYRGRDSRSNAAYAGVDESGGGGGGSRAVYTAAAAGVSLDLTNHTQVGVALYVVPRVSARLAGFCYIVVTMPFLCSARGSRSC